MRAITVLPGIANSARLDEVPEPPLSEGPVLVRTLALGVCATDREILVGAYGSGSPGTLIVFQTWVGQRRSVVSASAGRNSD